ncbi:MAG TPA: hypothetical protein VGF97_19700 [Rhizomicrobium sp.]|jgi:hypothetical protein
MSEKNPCHAMAGAHVAIDHWDEMMTVTAALGSLPARARDGLERTCRAIAAQNAVGIRFVNAEPGLRHHG